MGAGAPRERGRPARIHSRGLPLSFPAMRERGFFSGGNCIQLPAHRAPGPSTAQDSGRLLYWYTGDFPHETLFDS